MSENQVAKLIQAQKNLIEQMTKFVSNTKKTPLPRRTHGYYIARINGWHDLWQKFLGHEATLSQLKSSEDSEIDYFKDDLFQTQEALFYDFKGELVENVEKLEKAAQSGDPTIPGISATNSSTHIDNKSLGQSNLPRISLPKFSGNYNDWVSFRDLYLAVIHQNPNLEDVQKFHYLKTTLTGEAAYVIKQFSITQANYASAWKSLTERYENKRILVSSLLKTLNSQQKLSVESAHSIKGLLDVTSECIASLNNLQINTLHWDPLLIHLLIQRLPADTHKAWEESIGDTTDVPTWNEFKKFLELRFRTLEAISGTKQKTNFPYDHKRFEESNNKLKFQNFHMTQAACKICNENHPIRLCPRFLKFQPTQRLKIAKSKGYCINCLGKYHTFNKCLSTARCIQCGEKHHTLLHSAFSKQTTNLASNCITNSKSSVMTCPNKTNMEISASNVSSLFISENRQVLLATALLYVETPEGRQVARALIDPGSQITFVTNSLIRRMKIKMSSTFVKITGLANSEAASSRKMAKLILRSRYQDLSVEADAVALDTLTDFLPSKAFLQGRWEHIDNLLLADPTYHIPNRIDILIGADVYPLIIREGVKIGPLGTPMGQKTIFGWILSGQINSNTPKAAKTEVISLVNTLELNFDLRTFWEIEEPYPFKPENPEDILCEEIYRTTHKRKPDGSYVVRLPFKAASEPWLGSSRNIAMKRLLSMEKAIQNRGLFKEYNEVLMDYLTSNQMEEVAPQEKMKNFPAGNEIITIFKSNYLPHHAVIKEASSTTKLRVVFDASCKTSSGKSLNELLMTGPSLQRDLTILLLSWRFHKFVFSADIEKMYRRIWVHPDDTEYQRILWRSTVNQNVKDYRLMTVTFGVSCAPYLAIRTLQQLAEDEKRDFPEASKCLLNHFYVDDVLTGHDSIEKIVNLRKDLTLLLKRGGFLLRKFAANHPDILNDLASDDVVKEPIALFDGESTIKALGISWNPKEDAFCYKLTIDMSGEPTKRSILSKIAKLFDPSGWLSPIIICGKILMQKLWLVGIDWDTHLPEDLLQEWVTFAYDLKAIEQIRLPRWLGYLTTAKIEYHGFCDSSERAYAAVIYARTITSDGHISIQLIISKTRVAPVKTISLPRLELCGAHLLSKLVTHLRKHLGQAEAFHLWTDSTVVLAWLNSHPNRWKSFVANRVSEIHNNTTECFWRHVPSEQNPADLASRGVHASELVKSKLWWKGPDWLVKNSEDWPKLTADPDYDLTVKEMKKISSYQLQIETEQIANRFSNFNRACRVVAYCRRFLEKCKRNNDKPMPSYLTVQELKDARLKLVQESQQYSYYQELEELQRKYPISAKSPIKSLNPFLDESNILRVGGRLENSSLTFAEKHPIILSRTSKLTSLLINYIHKITLHGGPNLVLATLRKGYWIPGVKGTIKKLLHQCITCFRWRKETANQIMGNLPPPRVNLERPFYAVGIDFAGPINIKLSKVRNAKTSKAYIAIFVCFATKAIHIEVVSDLTSEAFFAALRRFFSRRGVCKDIYSDNGTNFIGASKMLEKETNEAIKVSIQKASEAFATQNVTWHFIPPATPHFGGLWEAGVKSIKYHLRRIVGQTLLTFEELNTILIQIEAILNSRPLCPLTEDPEDLTPLTPGHFLIGNAPLTLPESDWDHVNISSLSRWQHLQKLKNDFWKRWSTEYLSRLQHRQKWKSEQSPVHIGDLVILKDENLSPSAWRLARVVETHRGKDSQTRVVTLKTSSTQLKRPITKICVLPFQKEQLA